MKIIPLMVLVLELLLLHPAIAQEPNPATPPLTAQERAWLAAHPTVRARVGDYPPYMLKEPRPAGLAVDYLDNVAKRFGFKVEFIPATTPFDAAVADVGGARQHYDLLLTFTRTPEREQQFAITDDYLAAPWVLYARQDSPYIIGLESLTGKTVASEKGFLMTQKLKQDFPKIQLLEVATALDALLAVATGQADAYVGNLAIGSFLIKEHHLSNLVVAAPTPYGINTQAMAVRKDWPELASLINKGMAAMTAEERQAILQKWVGVEMKLEPNYTLVGQILAAATLVLLAVVYWNRRLAREIVVRQRIESELRNSEAQLQEEKYCLQRAENELQQEQEALKELNETLEQRVAARTAEVRAANAAILEREESLKFVLDGSRLGIWDWNIETGEVRRNDYWAEMLGYTLQEIDDATAGRWLDLIHPDDRQQAWQSIEDHLAGRTPLHEVEYRMRTRDGGYRWILDRARITRRNSEGRAVRMSGTHQDITERKRAEQQLRDSARHLHRLFENIPIGMFQSTPQGQYIFVNPALAAMFGFDSPAQAIATVNRTSIAEALYVDPSRRPQLVEEVEQHEGLFRTFQNRYRRRDGSVFDAILCFSEQTDPFSGERFLYGFVQDISDRVKAENQIQETLRRLQVATEAAEAANAAKSEFLAHMSHEIRTPLNAVLGLTQVLNREPLTANQRDMVERIQAAGQSLLAIINDVLDFSKIEAGQLRLELRPFYLGTLLAKLNSLMGQAAQAKGLTLRVEPPAVPPGWLLGDALRLEQVLVNLTGNAIKFTERGEVVVRVKPSGTGETAVRLRFEVQDTGIGIAPEALARLFQSFTQAEAGITRRFGGTGLGLSICKRLVELMGGEIGVDSQGGQGSTFWFELPFQRTAEGEAEAPAVAAPALPLGPRLAGRHLLVVDDNALNRDLVERMLTLEGAQVTLAADGQQALQHLKVRPAAFAAVLMDVQMPVLDGLSATRAIRSQLGLTELPVIALTAGVLTEQQQATRAAGINDFLAKPVDLEQMVATLLRWTRPPAPAAAVLPPAPEAPRPDAADQTPSAGLPEIPGFDAQQVVLTFGDDREFFLELLGMFCASFRDTAQEVRADLATGARDAAARRLHTLKGTAGNVGALELMRSAQALERAVIDGQPDVEPRLEQFTIQLDDLIQAAAPWLREHAEASPLDSVVSMFNQQHET